MTNTFILFLLFGIIAALILVLRDATRGKSSRRTAKVDKPRRYSRWHNSRRNWEKMGRDFEKFMITRFSKHEYQLIEWRSDKYIHGWGGPSSSRAPDLLLEHIPTRNRFAIECKYRSHIKGTGFRWARPDQLDNYRNYQTKENVPVYVAIGIGGNPQAPNSLFIVRLERMKFPDVMLHYLEQFRFPANVTGLEFG